MLAGCEGGATTEGHPEHAVSGPQGPPGALRQVRCPVWLAGTPDGGAQVQHPTPPLSGQCQAHPTL